MPDAKNNFKGQGWSRKRETTLQRVFGHAHSAYTCADVNKNVGEDWAPRDAHWWPWDAQPGDPCLCGNKHREDT